jgi:hypothetical protein
MRTGEDRRWLLKMSLSWPVLGMVMLAVGLTACGSGEAESVGSDPAPPTTAESGRKAPAAMVALSPLAEVNLAEGFTFSWELPAASQGGTWKILVFDGGSAPIWESPRMTFSEFEAPPALLLRLQPERAYTWRVVGGMDEGGRGKTPDTRFTTR